MIAGALFHMKIRLDPLTQMNSRVRVKVPSLMKSTTAWTLCFLLLLLTLSSAANETYTHAESGLAFPQKYGSFHRDNASNNALTGSFIVSYNQRKETGQEAAITLYLDKRQINLDEELADLETSVKAFNWDATVLLRKKRNLANFEGRLVLFKFPGANLQISEGCLFLVGDYR